MAKIQYPKEMEELAIKAGLIQPGAIEQAEDNEPELKPTVDLSQLPPRPHESVAWGAEGVPPDYIKPTWAEYGYKVWPNVKRAIMMMVGPRGTGKNTVAYHIADQWENISPCKRKAIVLHVNCKADDAPSSLIGTVGIRPNKESGFFEDYLRHGPLYMGAWLQNTFPQYQTIVYFNEANYWRPAVQSGLNSIGDDTQAFYSAITGERIETKGLKLILDMNANYAGTQQVQEALKDRFHTMYATYLPPEDEIKLLRNRTRVTESMAKRLIKMRNVCRQAAAGKKAGSVKMRFDASFRLVQDAAECMEHGMDPNLAVREAVLGRVGYEDEFVATRQTLTNLAKSCGFNIEA